MKRNLLLALLYTLVFLLIVAQLVIDRFTWNRDRMGAERPFGLREWLRVVILGR
jgi:hypothetical protein